jgi:hypothetical protein
MTHHQLSTKANEPKTPAPKPPVLWDRSRAHRDRLGHRIAELRRTGHA